MKLQSGQPLDSAERQSSHCRNSYKQIYFFIFSRVPVKFPREEFLRDRRK
jgi:hypothetical protein